MWPLRFAPSINVADLIRKQAQVMGSWVLPIHYYHDLVELMVTTGTSFAPLSAASFPIAEAAPAFAAAASLPAALDAIPYAGTIRVPMSDADAERLNTQPEEYTETADSGGEDVGLRRKGQDPLGDIPFQLAPEELSAPGALKMIVGEVHRLRDENIELGKYREKFHVCDKDAAKLRERIKQSTAKDIVFGTALSVGAVFLGFARSFWSSQPAGWIWIICGAALFLAGVVGRIVSK